MKVKLFLMVLVATIVAALFAVPALAQGFAQDAESYRQFCAPWTWAWFRTGGGWWYWQWFHDCWDPFHGWFRVWGGWGWW